MSSVEEEERELELEEEEEEEEDVEQAWTEWACAELCGTSLSDEPRRPSSEKAVLVAVRCSEGGAARWGSAERVRQTCREARAELRCRHERHRRGMAVTVAIVDRSKLQQQQQHDDDDLNDNKKNKKNNKKNKKQQRLSVGGEDDNVVGEDVEPYEEGGVRLEEGGAVRTGVKGGQGLTHHFTMEAVKDVYADHAAQSRRGNNNNNNDNNNNNNNNNNNDEDNSTAKKGGFGWLWWLGAVALVVALLLLRFRSATFDVRIEDLNAKHALLGLQPGAPWTQVKSAFRKMSLTQHPDKLPSCDSACQIKWRRITDAYHMIRDFHSGKLTISKPATRFDEDFAKYEMEQHRTTFDDEDDL